MNKTKAVVAQLRKEAEERQEKYSKLSIKEKIDLAKSRNLGVSKREIERLTKRLEEQKSKKEK